MSSQAPCWGQNQMHQIIPDNCLYTCLWDAPVMRDIQSHKEFLSQGNISLTVLLEVWGFFFWSVGFLVDFFCVSLNSSLPLLYLLLLLIRLFPCWSAFLFVTAFCVFEEWDNRFWVREKDQPTFSFSQRMSICCDLMV